MRVSISFDWEQLEAVIQALVTDVENEVHKGALKSKTFVKQGLASLETIKTDVVSAQDYYDDGSYEMQQLVGCEAYIKNAVSRIKEEDNGSN